MEIIVKDHPFSVISESPDAPKGPAVDAFLTDRAGREKIPLFAVIDSGADISCTKWAKIMELQSQLENPLPMESIQDAHTGRVIFTYSAYIILGGKRFTPELGIYCPEDNLFGLEETLIGREIQKEFILTLDGPNEVLSIEIQ